MADNDKPPRKKLGDDALTELEWKGGPKYLERDLRACFEGYKSNPSSALAAFQAIERIAQHWDDPDVEAARGDTDFGMPPHHKVLVPWWVIKVIGLLWYRHSTAEDSRQSLGQAFGIEGEGRGARGTRLIFETQLKWMYIALEVARRIPEGQEQVESGASAAVHRTAIECNLSEDLVWKAWGKYRERVRKSISNWKACGKSSRSS